MTSLKLSKIYLEPPCVGSCFGNQVKTILSPSFNVIIAFFQSCRSFYGF